MSDARSDGRRHPEFCSEHLCTTRGADIAHRHVPEVLTPRGEGQAVPDPQRPTVTWQLEQDDEVDRDGFQVVHPPLIALGVGDERARMSLDEAAVLGARLLAMVARGRGLPYGMVPEQRAAATAGRVTHELMFVERVD